MSPELEKMARRAALPISVVYEPYRYHPGERTVTREYWLCAPYSDIKALRICNSAAQATRAYFALCDELSNPATSSPAGKSGGCSATSPEGVGL